MRSDAWWVCHKCDKPLIRVGKKYVTQAMLEHRKICHPIACFSIKQVPQKRVLNDE